MKKVLILRTCNADLTAHSGFRWPESGPVTAPDWSPTAECGQGLHGLLWGEGDGSLLNWGKDARWLVVETDAAKIVDLGGKVKFPKGEVVHCGDQKSATDFIAAHGAAGKAIVGYTATAGRYGTATAGDRGTATAGRYGTATAGAYGTATAGVGGTATAGRYGTATAGRYGTATAERYGTATAGRYGTATAGAYGTATAGYAGTATAGYAGTATAGERGTATAGRYGTATAGRYGRLSIEWWDGQRYRLSTAYVGENGIKANIAYKLNEKWEFVRK